MKFQYLPTDIKGVMSTVLGKMLVPFSVTGFDGGSLARPLVEVEAPALPPFEHGKSSGDMASLEAEQHRVYQEDLDCAESLEKYK